MAFKLELISDVKSFLRGTGDVGKALDDVADSLDDVARDAGTTSSKVGRELGNVESDAKGAADTLERRFRDAFDDVKSNSAKSFDAVGDNAKRGSNRAGEATGAFKDEAKANFAETASSFDGSMSSIADMAQGTLGGLASAIPGAGIFAGLAAAGAGAWLAQWTQSQADLKEVHDGMLDDLVESEGKYLSDSYVQEQYWSILKGESKIIKQREFESVVRNTGLTAEQVALGLAGNDELLTLTKDRLIDRQRVFQGQLEDESTTNDSAARAGLTMLDGQIAAIDGRSAAITKGKDEVERAIETQKRWQTTTTESVDEARAKYDGLGRMIAGLPQTAAVKVSVEPDFTVFDRLLKNKTGSVGVYVTPRAGTPVP